MINEKFKLSRDKTNLSHDKEKLEVASRQRAGAGENLWRWLLLWKRLRDKKEGKGTSSTSHLKHPPC